MMVINAMYKCRSGKREEFRDVIRTEGIDVASRSEEGNYRYDFFFSTENPDEILLLEFWKDVDSWKAHKTLPHYIRLSELKEVYVVSTEVNRYFTDDEA